MKTFVYIIKGILLWVTALSITLFIIGGFESLAVSDKWLTAGFWFTINIVLGYICYKCLSYRELYKLSGSMWLDRLLRD